SDLPKSKRRKALVVSSAEFNLKNKNTILMMITSATRSTWYSDIEIKSWKYSGLKKPCVARMKLFTLDNRLIISKTGELIKKDRNNVQNAIKEILNYKP
ncbi:MAG: type II toxin-antitoxin system PemK/MazF family toxin, partial [Spirochaetota bacterium]